MTWTSLVLFLAALVLGGLLAHQYLFARKISLNSVLKQLELDGSPSPCPDTLFFAGRFEVQNAALYQALHTANLSFLWIKVDDEELLVISQNGYKGQLKLKFEEGKYTTGQDCSGPEPLELPPLSCGEAATAIINAVRTVESQDAE